MSAANDVDVGRLRAELEQLRHELRATQDQLRSLIDRNADAIVVVDAETGLVRFANPAAGRLFSRPAEQLVGSELGLPLLVDETTEIDIVGAVGPGVAEMRVVSTEWGRQPALLAVLRDITERKRAAQEREELFKAQLARAEAERALQEREEFMAMASHELKTPVSTLAATAQLLQRLLDRQEQLDAATLRRNLDRLHEGSRRLVRLIDHLLDFSRISTGGLAIVREAADLSALAQSVVAAFQLTTTKHTIEFRGPETLETAVDPMRIEQVVTNLVDNAIKYSPDGGAIEVELTRQDSEAHLSVRDHGVGIPPERLGRLFERFYRAHPQQHVSGMGLGLFISQHIAQLHGGSIEAESPSDGGSRFTVRLPLV
jgi:signal transduction histidine kinase